METRVPVGYEIQNFGSAKVLKVTAYFAVLEITATPVSKGLTMFTLASFDPTHPDYWVYTVIGGEVPGQSPAEGPQTIQVALTSKNVGKKGVLVNGYSLKLPIDITLEDSPLGQ